MTDTVKRTGGGDLASVDLTEEKRWSHWMQILQRITDDTLPYYPKTVLVFGSTARYLAREPVNHFPKDIDLVVVAGNFPYKTTHTDYGVPVESHHYRVDQIVAIAKILRYDPKAIALPKLYGKMFLKRHCIDVIVAAMLLGPAYGRFGIEQIEVDGMLDARDYSVHRVLYGEQWWARLCEYACDRRGPIKRFSDKIVQQYEFKE